MTTLRWWTVLLLPLAACVRGADDPDAEVPAAQPPARAADVAAPGGEPGPEAAQPDGAQVAAGEVRLVLRPLNGSSLEGRGQLIPVVNDTRVTVLLTGAHQAVHQGHIHRGSCEDIGEPVAPLQPVTTVAGPEASRWVSSTVDIPLFSLLRDSYVVVYQAAGGNPGAPAACGHIPYEARPDTE